MMELKSFGVILPYDIPNMMGKIKPNVPVTTNQMAFYGHSLGGLTPDMRNAAECHSHCGTIFALWHENGKGTSLNI